MDPVQPSYIMITTQILTIIYIFAVLGNKIWWKLAAVLQCVEVTLVWISVLILQVPSPIEMAYILAFTSQAAAIGVIWASSRGIFRNRIQKHTADHLLGLGLVTCLVLAILLPLSLVGHFPRWTTLQWMLFMIITTVAHRILESTDHNTSPISGSEIELALVRGSRSMKEPPPESSPHLNEQASICSRAPLLELSRWIRATGEKMWGDLRRSGHR
jgi:hypothetical protein